MSGHPKGRRNRSASAIVHGIEGLVNLDAPSSDVATSAPPPAHKKSYQALATAVAARQRPQPNNNNNRDKRDVSSAAAPAQQKSKQGTQTNKGNAAASNRSNSNNGDGASANLSNAQYYLAFGGADLQAPPEARLPRWSVVRRQLFPSFTKGAACVSAKKREQAHSAALAGINEALARIERWRRVLASHGMLLRLRKLPAYIEATKALVEAVQSDRALERQRDALLEHISSQADVTAAEQEGEEEDADADNIATVEHDAGNDDDDDDEDDSDSSEWSAESVEGGASAVHAAFAKQRNASDDDDDDDDSHSASARQLGHDADDDDESSVPLVGASTASPSLAMLNAATLPMIYATAISRAVFEMTENSGAQRRHYSEQLDDRSTFRSRAQAISLPEELTEARNKIAHGQMPTLAQMRFAASLGLQYLFHQHWTVRAEALKEFRHAEEQHKRASAQQHQQQQQQHQPSSQKPQQTRGGGFGATDRRRQREEDDAKVTVSTAAAAAAAPVKAKLSLEDLERKVAALTSKK